MKINSEKLYDFINNLGTDEKVRFKVFYDDNYVTEIYWDGENFRWEPGTFTTGALFNPLYDFVEVEEEKKIEFKNIQGLNTNICAFKRYDITDKKNKSFAISNIQNDFEVIGNTINELIDNQKKIIDYLKSKGDE